MFCIVTDLVSSTPASGHPYRELSVPSGGGISTGRTVSRWFWINKINRKLRRLLVVWSDLRCVAHAVGNIVMGRRGKEGRGDGGLWYIKY